MTAAIRRRQATTEVSNKRLLDNVDRLGTVASELARDRARPKLKVVAADPMFSLIKKWREAEERFGDCVTALEQAQEAKRGFKAAERNWERANDASSRALRAVCSTVPTTREGFVALLEALEGELQRDMATTYSDGRLSPLWKTLKRAAQTCGQSG